MCTLALTRNQKVVRQRASRLSMTGKSQRVRNQPLKNTLPHCLKIGHFANQCRNRNSAAAVIGQDGAT